MKEKRPVVPSMKNILYSFRDFMERFSAWGFKDPILYKDNEPPYDNVVFVLVTPERYDPPQSEKDISILKYLLDGLTKDLKRYITCKFVVTLLKNMREDFIARFKSPRTWGIRLTPKMPLQSLERQLVNLFGRTWVFGSEYWIVEEKDKLSKQVLSTKEALERAVFHAVSYCKLEEAISLILYPAENVSVTTLEIQELYFAKSLYLRLNECLSQACSLQHLYLKPYNKMSFNQTAQLFDTLRENRGLLSLRLASSCSGAVEIAAPALQTMIKTNTTLQTLCLYRIDQVHPIPVLFGDSLALNYTLTSLHLKFCVLEENEWNNLVYGLHQNRSVTDLNFSCTSPSPNILKKIIFLLERPEKPVRSLNLSRNPIPKRAAYFLSHILQKNPSLKKLKLKHCRIPTKGLKSILKALWNNSHLHTLKINLTILHDSSLVHLKELFLHNTTISHLGVSSYLVDIQEFLYWLLTMSSTLISLNLKGPLYCFWNIKDIFSALSYTSTLRTLLLDNELFDEKLSRKSQSLADKLKNNFSLTNLKFKNFKSTKSDFDPFFSLIERNREAHRQSRKLFIYHLLWLELKIPEWQRFPLDLKIYFLIFMGFTEKSFGKNKEQMRQCVKFISAQHEKCQALITAKQNIILFEKRETKDFVTSYRFRFFSVAEFPAKPFDIKVERNKPLQIFTHITNTLLL